MSASAEGDEWAIIEKLLPAGWRERARSSGAFRRARYVEDPGEILRLLLFHAVNNAGLRDSVAQAEAAGLPAMSQVALFKRLCTSGAWLGWIAGELCRRFREDRDLPAIGRLRAVDSTTIQGPGAKGSEWRLHYSLDLRTLDCDWHDLTDTHQAEALERVPVQKGDVLVADRGFSRPAGIRAVAKARAHAIVRLRWCHARLVDSEGRRIRALRKARRLRVGQIGEWPVRLPDDKNKEFVEGRVIVLRLPAPLAERAERRAARRACRKQRRADPRSLQAAHYVMLFTTVPAQRATAAEILEAYRFRWQIELAFKRHKQILRLGRLPHKHADAARGCILAKLVVALLLEILYRNSVAFSPWGYPLDAAGAPPAAA